MKTEKALPNMARGWVCKQYVRRGQKLCGPYLYRFWREGGRLRKQYVPCASAEKTIALCTEWQSLMRKVRAQRKATRKDLMVVRGMARTERTLRQNAG
jgi:hypothetical protein